MDQAQPLLVSDPLVMPGFVPGHHPPILVLNAMAAELASTDIPVLILGESGTGKDMYARLIHYLSPQRNSHLQKVNCSAINPSDFAAKASDAPSESLNPEQMPGIYLDNIQELDLPSQRALLAQIFDTGSMGCRHVSGARLISSAARNLEPDIASGRFRHELYFRLNGACLRLPPLRERTEDIPVLTDYFLARYSEITKRPPPSMNSKALQVLMDYSWPGNIRELESFVRKTVVFGDIQGPLEELKNLQAGGANRVPIEKNAPLKVAARAASKEAERELILRALERTHWNRKRAAHDLKISYKALLYKIKQIGLGSSANEV